MTRTWFAAAIAVLLAACNPQAPQPQPAQVETSNDASRGGAVSDATAPPPVPPAAEPVTERSVDWWPIELPDTRVLVSCEHDYAEAGDGVELDSLGYSAMRKAMAECQERGRLRLRYEGKITPGFTSLIERSVELLDTLGIEQRILDIDSSGGQIEQAIVAGDIIAESGWTIWVREDSSCHSSCVLILAAGDMRMLAGRVGIHRMVRIGSEARSRAELNAELEEVHGQVRQYLARNGAAFAVADLMMTVPNRSLRLLTSAELRRFGLDGRNAVADDLQRIQLARKCGEAFVHRKDAFFRAFDEQCQGPEEEVGGMGECGMALRQRFGFPDATCPAESPMSEYEATADVPRRGDRQTS
ncbi:hypothetical protein [Novilysobacter spongiicola]|uniref:Uncharacterized protein n=1 Tax=Lysobacter spongiicola DSM 21749 TaxID=1122188 RepID=A0A1T4SGG2_9GAMM|nr:hypothetical protein [Lysobacter spongiicola]SKA27269.1 hypothetical protein SAMN02745674_02832 [Lysobacter spongiicola DSM 21749]